MAGEEEGAEENEALQLVMILPRAFCAPCLLPLVDEDLDCGHDRALASKDFSFPVILFSSVEASPANAVAFPSCVPLVEALFALLALATD